MVDGQHKLSRRALLGAVCASPALSVIPAEAGTSGRPAPSPSPWDPGFRRDDEWGQALARFHEAQAVLDSARSEPDENAYDRLLDAQSEALTTLLALPAPDLPALAAKLDVIVPQLAWELTGCEDCSRSSAATPTASPRPDPERFHPKHQRTQESLAASR